MLTREKSVVNVSVVPCRSRVTKSGKTIWKLYDRVPITAIMASGTHSSGTLRA